MFLAGCGMTELYPQVPVVTTFGCFFDKTNPDAITTCGSCQNAADNLTKSAVQCSSFSVPEYTPTQSSDATASTKPSTGAPSIAPPAPAASPNDQASADQSAQCSCKIEEALECAETTRQVDADFLMCREERQLGVGALIASMGAGSGGAFTAGSILAAGIVGSIAGGALGLDYGTFNSAKSPAFGNATAQVDCIYRSTLPTKAELTRIETKYKSFDQALQSVHKDSTGYDCRDYDEGTIWRLYASEDLVGYTQEKYAEEQVADFGVNVYLAVVSSQVGAFAASQSGIVTPASIGSGLTAESYTIPGPTQSQYPPINQAAAAKMAKSMVNSGIVDSCRNQFSKVEQAGTDFRASLAAFQLPDPQFQACLSLSSSAPAAASPTSASPSGSKSPKGAPSSGATPPPAGGAPNSSPVGPSATPSGSAGAPAGSGASPLTVQILTNNAAVDDSKFSAGASLQVTGGVPPYYWIAVDDGVDVVNPEVRLQKAADLPAAANPIKRVLIADQGGSQQIVYVMPSPTPTATPTPTPCPTPVH
jgi:hypothetical protein